MWTRLENHPGEKYELKVDGTLLGTIFHKPTTKRWVIWVSCPIAVKKVRSMVTDSYDFATLEEAQAGFDKILAERYIPWLEAVSKHLNTPPLCQQCGKYSADSPSDICLGCEAYNEHLH